MWTLSSVKKPLFIVAACLFTVFSNAALSQERPIDKFTADVERRDKSLEAMNLKFYESVELVSKKTAKVKVTEQWMKYVTPADNQGNINSLFDSWRFSFGPAETGVTLIVVAPDGSVIRKVSN